MLGDGWRLNSAAVAAVTACFLPTRRPSVDLEPGASITAYRVFDVGPVVDESGWPFPYDITDSLRIRLVRRLREHGYTVTVRDSAGEGPVLRIASRLTSFRAGGILLTMGAGPASRCRLTSVLFDGQSGRRLGEITAAELEEGLAPFTVLMTCARIVADELDRRVRGK